jgi:hypothetical protein
MAMEKDSPGFTVNSPSYPLMKKIILSFVVGLLAVAASGQGTVTFQNASSIPGWSPVVDRNVKFGSLHPNWYPLLVTGDNVSSNYAGVDLSGLRVALYYTPGMVADSAWQSVNLLALGNTVATFKQSTSTTAGSWFGGTRSLNQIAPHGGITSLMVVVWDIRIAADPLSWQAQLFGLWGRSSVFHYITPPSLTPAPADFLMNNLTSFTINHNVPEPTTTTLTGLGAVILAWMRSRRQS